MTTYNWPFKEPYAVTCPFGKKGAAWKCGYHSGLDLVSRAAGGDGLVHPIAAGTVLRAAASAAYGNYVSVQHPDGCLSLYAHLSACLVKEGQPVTRDTALGREGATGAATGPHLHLEIHKGAYRYPATVDPAAFIAEKMEEKMEVKVMSTYCELPVLHAIAIPPERFKVLDWRKGKRTTAIQNYACFPFQASGAVPVGNVIADGAPLAKGGAFSTIWLDAALAVGFGKTPPAGVRQAVSGLPLLTDGRRATLQEALSEGWDTSPLYPTTHAILGVGGDGLLRYYVFASKKSGAAASYAEIQDCAGSLGLRHALLGDGGGSTILDFGGKNKIVSEGNRQLAALITF
ncbi:MAG TPA: peptidoglycan DD-metalloendopeptidase family protein [Candidatus Acidoferrum sp.]|nr:peptidoglycan DD-metalloendopeptidase family protein [Candidatus Acidoferrum sp.]